jgi:large subunit ribosomal protein L15
MTIKIHDLKPPSGSKSRAKRVGRGIGGQGGKTAGRGHKGQGARGSVKAKFEGGQMPLVQRIPKLRGFTNPFRIEYQGVNLDVIEQSQLSEVSPHALYTQGLVHKGALVKVLARGELTRPVAVKAHRFSKAAEAAIIQAGGSVELVPLPWGDRRPPAKGNALTNR